MDFNRGSAISQKTAITKLASLADTLYRNVLQVKIVGSNAGRSCNIVVMRHTESNVASVGHFDNFSCWQFGEEGSAHKQGLRVMMEEIEFLSKGDMEKGQIQVSVFGGYTDERGDAARNSMSLLSALHESDRLLEVRDMCTELRCGQDTLCFRWFISVLVHTTPARTRMARTWPSS